MFAEALVNYGNVRKEMGKVDDGMLQILEDQFHKLDVSGDGMLSADDVIDKSTEDISITKVLI